MYLFKPVIPHNDCAIKGELSVYMETSYTDSLERSIGGCDQVDNIVSRRQVPIFIKIYFFTGTVVKMDVSERGDKLDQGGKCFHTQANGKKWAAQS